MKHHNLKFKINFYSFFVVFSFLFLVFVLNVAYAVSLTYVSDLISTSAPNATSTHTIQFTLTNSVPASGGIIITLEDGAFSIPASFDYTDVDLSVSSGGFFVDRQLAMNASSSEDGVSVVSGSGGSITFTLSSSTGISSGDIVKVELGDNATFGGTGDQTITNPITARSYKIFIATKDELGFAIDSAKAMVAIINQVTISPIEIVSVAPLRSNGLPSGEIPAGNVNIELSLNTNTNAVCRYATTSDVLYDNMSNTFSVTGITLHTVVETNFEDGQSYSFYVRCSDTYSGIENTDDYIISFSLKSTPEGDADEGTTVGGGGGGGGGSTYYQQGNIYMGSQKLYLSSISLEGWSYPLSTVTILKDGEVANNVKAKDDGSFKETIYQLERGAYTFAIYATNSDGEQSATHSSTLFLEQGTNNRISNIVIPPIVELENDTVEIGDKVVVFGESVPNSEVELFVSLQVGKLAIGDIKKFTATSTKGVPGIPDGTWEISFDTDSLEKGTYKLKARSIVPSQTQAESDFSRMLFLGVGEDPKPDFSLRADINGDGKVNLVDFSILLVYWGTSETNSDINSDGSIDLGDFSIMLFYWTG